MRPLELGVTVLFWTSLAAMTLAAMLFVAAPLLRLRARKLLAPLLVLLFIPVAAVSIYAALGSPPNDPERSSGDRPANVARNSERQVPSVASLVGGLAARLEKEPGDADGWLLLARSYAHLGRQEEARQAYARATGLGKLDPEFEASLTDTVADNAQTVEIRGRVRLAPGASDRVLPGDTVFVFAKRADGAPMPLAVVRKPAAELPFEFALSDDDAMVAGQGLAGHDRVLVQAKISRTGNAMQPLPGLQVEDVPVDTASTEIVELLIESADPAGTAARSLQ
jgi:hypothetical protein